VFSPSYVKNQVGIAVWIHIWVFCFIDLYSFLCQCHAVFIAIALWYSLKLGIVITSALLFLLSIALAILSFVFQNENELQG
jgi:hypothetical protein